MSKKINAIFPLHRISMSTENYLEAIYILEEDHKLVRSVDLAQFLGVSRASVSKALNLLKDEDYIKHQYYGQIKLTDKGRDLAQEILERHKIIYLFLTKCLKVEEQRADEEACLMEHTVSKETVLAWKNFLFDLYGKEEILKEIDS